MSCEKNYICLSESKPLDEDEVRICCDCGKHACDTCGGDVVTIEEYDKNMRETRDDN